MVRVLSTIFVPFLFNSKPVDLSRYRESWTCLYLRLKHVLGECFSIPLIYQGFGRGWESTAFVHLIPRVISFQIKIRQLNLGSAVFDVLPAWLFAWLAGCC